VNRVKSCRDSCRGLNRYHESCLEAAIVVVNHVVADLSYIYIYIYTYMYIYIYIYISLTSTSPVHLVRSPFGESIFKVLIFV